MTWLLILTLTWSLTGETKTLFRFGFESEQACFTYAALKVIETVADGVDVVEAYCIEHDEEGLPQ